MINWAYIAGIFDGEGSLAMLISGSKMSPQITITQAGDEGVFLLRAIQNFLRAHDISSGFNKRPQIFKHRKPVYRLYLNGDDVLNFLRMVMPYLHVKRVLALDLLRYRSFFPAFVGGRPPKEPGISQVKPFQA
jgi:hypothetical protein